MSLYNLGAGSGGIAPAFYFDALAFEVFVDGEEVGDLLKHVGIDFGKAGDIVIPRIVFAYAENLLVGNALVEHLKDADGAYLHDAAGEAGSIDENEDVEGVTIVGQSAGDKAVVAWIVNGRVEVTIKPEEVKFFIVLVFVDALFGYFDDGIDDVGGVVPHG